MKLYYKLYQYETSKGEAKVGYNFYIEVNAIIVAIKPSFKESYNTLRTLALSTGELLKEKEVK